MTPQTLLVFIQTNHTCSFTGEGFLKFQLITTKNC